MPAGRPKGSKNFATADIKENIVAVFTRLGGTAAMAEWAKENQSEFYHMYVAIAPKEIVADVTHHKEDELDLTDAQLAELAAIAAASSEESDQPSLGAQESTELH